MTDVPPTNVVLAMAVSVRLVAAAAGATVMVTGAEAPAVYVLSPEYCAVSVCVPTPNATLTFALLLSCGVNTAFAPLVRLR